MTDAQTVAHRALKRVTAPEIIGEAFFRRMLNYLADAPDGPQKRTVEAFIDSPGNAEQRSVGVALAMLTTEQLTTVQGVDLEQLADHDFRLFMTSIYMGTIEPAGA